MLFLFIKFVKLSKTNSTQVFTGEEVAYAGQAIGIIVAG